MLIKSIHHESNVQVLASADVSETFPRSFDNKQTADVQPSSVTSDEVQPLTSRPRKARNNRDNRAKWRARQKCDSASNHNRETDTSSSAAPPSSTA